MESANKQCSQCEQLQAYITNARKAEETFQIAFKPIKALWTLASKQNRAAVKEAEKRVHEAFGRKLRKLWKSREKEAAALVEDFRTSREQRLASWQQYLDGND